MDMAIILGLLATTITIVGFVYGFLRNFKAGLHVNISRIESDLNDNIARLETDIKSLGSKMEDNTRAQNARTDKLYEMFVDLLKSQQRRTNP